MLVNDTGRRRGGIAMRVVVPWMIVFLIGVANSNAAQSTRPTLNEVVDEADCLVLGEVNRIRAFRTEDGGIRTEIEVQTLDILKGTRFKASSYQFEVGAGRLGELETRSVLDRPFRIGAIELFLLKRKDEGGWRLSALGFGRFEVLRRSGEAPDPTDWIQRPRLPIEGFEEPMIRVDEFKRRLQAR